MGIGGANREDARNRREGGQGGVAERTITADGERNRRGGNRDGERNRREEGV